MRAIAIALALAAGCGGEKSQEGSPQRADRSATDVDAGPTLPARVDGTYTLPEAPAARSSAVERARFVALSSSGALTTGAAGERVPGAATTREALAASAPPPAEAVAPAPAVDAAPAPPRGRKRRRDPAEEAIDRILAATEPGMLQLRLAGVMVEPGAGAPPDAPLLLADRARPAHEVIALLADLGAARLAVAAPGDPAARALAGSWKAAPKISLPLDTARVLLDEAGNMSYGEALSAAEPTAVDASALRARLEALARASSRPRVLIVDPADSTSLAHLVAAVSLGVEAGAEQIVLALPRPHGAGGGGEGTGTFRGGTIGGAGGFGAASARASRVTMGAITVGDGMTQDQAARVLRARLGTFRACYERDLETGAELAGQAQLSFRVTREGKVTGAKLGGDLPARVRDCVARQASAIRFPSPPADVPVTVDLTFFR